METEEIIKNLTKALLSWYDFGMNKRVLFISGGFPECEVLFDMLMKKRIAVEKINAKEIEGIIGNSQYDYIVMAGIIEKCKKTTDFLQKVKSRLAPGGKMLIVADNRFSISYFCGEKDLFSGHVLDGIDNYRKINLKRLEEIGGRGYSMVEIKKMLADAGIANYQFYSVLPSITRPQILLREGYIPNECLDVRIFPQYKSPETIYMEEEDLYEDLLENNMFHQMANGYFIECSIDGELTNVDQITVQGDRLPNEALATIIQEEKVLKKPLYKEGIGKIKSLMDNTVYLKRHNVPIIDAEIKDNQYIMPFVKGQIATDYFRTLLKNDEKDFFNRLAEFQNIILNSSEHVPYDKIDWRKFEPGWEKRKADDPNIDKWEKLAYGTDSDRENIGIILQKGFIDLVSLNCFHTDEGFRFFDQEFYIENLPANAVFIRTVDFIYRECREMEELCPRDEVLRYFNLYEHQNTWRRIGNDFLEKLRNEKELMPYHRNVRRDYHTVAANRLRMDFAQDEYEKLFSNIFEDIDDKKIFLFGSGRYSEQFIEQFGKYYEIAGIVDNNKEKWGTELSGINILSPDILLNQKSSFKVFICIKFYDEVLTQLKEMGIKNISVFNPQVDYRRPIKTIRIENNETPKKYHIGYVAGVFDLFHIGHLNLLRRAKEQCDYLIVGVVSDEQVISSKKTSPYISFDERIEIVHACRYVDEAVELPNGRSDTEDAWRMYHFDVQFSGSDYENDPVWLSKREFLRRHGAELVFFPYTQSVSSTMIKGELREKQ